MQQFHAWLEGKRLARQACRVVGDSRTGKTIACDAYRLKYTPTLVYGEPPIIPVIYWLSPPESGTRELFEGLLDCLKYQLSRGTLSELRARVYRTLGACCVELVIIDEAHRLRPKTLSDLSDIFDQLEIAVVLIGPDRLDPVIRRDEQVYRRFMACYRYQKLTTAQLVETTAIWEEHVLKLPQASNLASPKLQKILGPVTHGYIGLLDMIMREAAIRSLKQGQSRITLTTLSEVVAEYR